MLSKKVALKKEIVVTKKAKTAPKAKAVVQVKAVPKENKITEEVKEPKVELQLIKPRRIQTAEGWKRSMLLTKKKAK